MVHKFGFGWPSFPVKCLGKRVERSCAGGSRQDGYVARGKLRFLCGDGNVPGAPVEANQTWSSSCLSARLKHEKKQFALKYWPLRPILRQSICKNLPIG